MKVINFIIPYLVPVLLGLSLEILLFLPRQIVLIGTLASILVASAAWFLNLKKIRPWQTLALAVPPLLTTWGAFTFLIFIQGVWLRQIIIWGAVLLLYIYLEQIFVFLYRPSKFQRYSLQNVSIYILLISVYAILAASFGIVIFFNLSVLGLIVPVAVLTLAASFHLAWVTEIPLELATPYLVALPFIVTQSFIVASFLPTSIFVNAAVVSLVFYASMGIARNIWLNRLEKSVIRRYTLTSVITLIIILVTAKWI